MNPALQPLARGTLYVVATPIGNLGDFSPRAADTLRGVDFIAAEDTRVGAKLLNKFNIKTPQISYYAHNRREKGEHILARLLAGECCALISDAGTPAISDPGVDLVALCRQAGVPVVAVPGCSALTAALSVCGLPCGRFTFEGFLPVNKKNRRAHLSALADERRTMVFYEAPHKLLRTLEDLHNTLGDRAVAVCRELTKRHEEVLSTTLSGALAHFQETPPRGEFVLVLAGADREAAEPQPSLEDPLAQVAQLVRDGDSMSNAVRQVARLHGIPKNTLYNQAQKELEL